MKTNTLSSFKSIVFKYYVWSLYSCYNVDDPRSYKTTCVKCNFLRNLPMSLSWCLYTKCNVLSF